MTAGKSRSLMDLAISLAVLITVSVGLLRLIAVPGQHVGWSFWAAIGAFMVSIDATGAVTTLLRSRVGVPGVNSAAGWRRLGSAARLSALFAALALGSALFPALR